MKGLKLRLSRTLILVMGGLLLVGGSGAAALYVGSDRLFGPSYLEINGLECTTLQEMKLKQAQHTWVRRYVFTEGGDGPARLRTAIRVAKAVQAAQKADLVQVTVLDKAGPTQRAAMRGRAIGAQVVYIPDAAKAPDPGDPVFSAFYVEGAAAHGEFYGLRITPPLEDIEKIATALTDSADCISPVVETEADPHGGGHDAKGGDGHGKSSGKGKASGHGDAGGHGESGGHGEAPAAENGHAPAEGEHGAEGAAKEGDHGAESGGLISSITSKIFGSKTEVAAQESHAGAGGAPADGQQAADHTAPSPEHTAVAPQPGFVDRIKGMIFGAPETGVVVVQPSPAPVAAPSPAPADHAAPHDGIDPMKVAAPTQAAKPENTPASAVTSPAEAAPKPQH